jgi:hypothetical protein
MIKYVGNGKHLIGIPARDLTYEEWNALNDEKRQLLINLGIMEYAETDTEDLSGIEIIEVENTEEEIIEEEELLDVEIIENELEEEFEEEKINE